EVTGIDPVRVRDLGVVRPHLRPLPRIVDVIEREVPPRVASSHDVELGRWPGVQRGRLRLVRVVAIRRAVGTVAVAARCRRWLLLPPARPVRHLAVRTDDDHVRLLLLLPLLRLRRRPRGLRWRTWIERDRRVLRWIDRRNLRRRRTRRDEE